VGELEEITLSDGVTIYAHVITVGGVGPTSTQSRVTLGHAEYLDGTDISSAHRKEAFRIVASLSR
jgi:hypothetical protein